jgi:MoaA/NifB/PqqE/SkfB family radical SAM enzyme
MKKYINILHLIFLELKRLIFRTRYFAEIDVTDNCNLRCAHCYHFKGKEKLNNKELPLDVWRIRFEELYKGGVRIVLLVGGEPALRSDILMLADRVFPFVFIITNGTIKVPNEFKHLLFVSLDGGRERNDSIRGDGVFSKTLSNYSQDSRVILNVTVTNDNYNEVEHIVRIAKENGLRGVVCNIYTPTVGKRDALFIKTENRKTIISELKRVKKLYPDYFLLTRPMLGWYEFPDHMGFCHWGDEALHYTVGWEKRRCFTGLDCSNCGCFAGALQNPLKLLLSPLVMKKLCLV